MIETIISLGMIYVGVAMALSLANKNFTAKTFKEGFVNGLNWGNFIIDNWEALKKYGKS